MLSVTLVRKSKLACHFFMMETVHRTAAGNKIVDLEIVLHGLLKLLHQLRTVGGIAFNIPKDLFVLAGNPGADKVIHCSREFSLAVRGQYCLSMG